MTIAQGAEFVLTGAKPSTAPANAASRIKRTLGLGAAAALRALANGSGGGT